MPQPTPYDRIINFQNDQALHPTDPYPAPSVDAEYNAIKITTDEILQNLALIQRDDGQLANDSVGLDQLREEVQIGFNAPVPWVTNHDYIHGDTVFKDNGFWFCLVSHKSGDFATDVANGLWYLIADFSLVAVIGAPMFVSDAAPPLAAAGSQWYESDTGNTYVRYIEPISGDGQWVQINGEFVEPPGAIQPSDDAPFRDGVAVPGTSVKYARGDHVHPLDPTKVSTTGDTMSGDLTITKAAPRLLLSAVGATGAQVFYIKDNLLRWQAGMRSAAPANDFIIGRYDDSGVVIDNPITIERATGLVALLGDPTAALGVATKQYVDNYSQPNFHVFLSANQVLVSATPTKVQFNTESFDSANAYDNVTNFRFTPQRAGKYRVTVNLSLSGQGTAAASFLSMIYKNGAELIRARWQTPDATNLWQNTVIASSLVAMNGTTDFLEGFSQATGTSNLAVGGTATGTLSFFEAHYIGP